MSDQRYERVGVYRVEHAANDEEKHLIWQWQIDGVWLFLRASTVIQVSQFTRNHTYLGQDAEHGYWR